MDSGGGISCMARELKNGSMEIGLLATLSKGKGTDLESTCGLTAHASKADGSTKISMASAATSGQRKKSLLAIG